MSASKKTAQLVISAFPRTAASKPRTPATLGGLS